jgi:hypothetical protein
MTDDSPRKLSGSVNHLKPPFITMPDGKLMFRTELVIAQERIKKLEADLLECREYLETEMDVIDGPHNAPLPNRAMQLVNLIDETLHGAGAV